MRALALNVVTVMAVLTDGTHFLAVFPEEAFGAELVAARPVPAPVARDAASLRHLTWLLALAVATSEERKVRFLKLISSSVRKLE